MISWQSNTTRGNRNAAAGIRVIASAVLAVLATGCQSGKRSPNYQTGSGVAERNVAVASRLNESGLALIEKGEFKQAEELFREALTHDLYFASAHNNLGLTLLEQDRHYEAAWEFDFAAKIAPGAPEPRANLGRLYEELGRLGAAIDQYEAALKMNPRVLDTMRSLARAYVRAGRNDERLTDLLEELLSIPSDYQWDAWVRGQLIRVGRVEDGASPILMSPRSGR